LIKNSELPTRLKEWAKRITDGDDIDIQRFQQQIFKVLKQDAAYALGEEAFRAGYRAGHQAGREAPDQSMHPRDEDDAWADYEPSEDVKALIDG
jgi:hypothetical protein